MQPVDPLAVPAVRLGASAQLVAVAGIDQEDLETLGLEQLVQGNPVDAGRFHGDRGDLVLPQEGGYGFQASRMSRKLAHQAGSGVGGETNTDPVGATAQGDAGGVRMLHGQSFDVGSLLLTTGLALDLGPCFATVVGLTLGLSLSSVAAGRRGGGWLLSGRRCGHGRTPQKRRGEGIGGRDTQPSAGGGGGERTRVEKGSDQTPGRSPPAGATRKRAGKRRSPALTHG